MSEFLEKLLKSSPFFGANAPYIEELYEKYLDNPASVPENWQQQFKALNGSGEADFSHARILEKYKILGRQGQQARSPRLKVNADKQAAVLRLINAYRVRGHQVADLDPIHLRERAQISDLELEFHGLSPADLEQEFNTGSLFASNTMKLRDIIALMKSVYCGSIGYEFMHIIDTDQKRWLQDRIESRAGDFGLSTEQKKRLLRKLTAAEGLEKYLHTRYVGQKRFSLEGSDSLIPLLHELIQHNGTRKIEEIVIGMAHRGRLNVLVNILGKSPKQLFEEFEGLNKTDDPYYSGDVKYHMGYSSDVDTPGGPVHLALAFNPSHLEIIGPVVAGSTRARQARRRDKARRQVMPVLLHGDAAFAGQGVIMELFNMSQARGFFIGGTMHIIVNNQIGFTTSNPLDARSTMYTTEVAKMVQAPILHVNGDNPEAVRFAMEIASDFRLEFRKDVVIDVVSYRRHGHNEADEPATTQPMMYGKIRKHESPRSIYAQRLVDEKIIGDEESEQMVADYRASLDAGEPVAELCDSSLKIQHIVDWSPYMSRDWGQQVDTSILKKDIQRFGKGLTTIPDGFSLHSRVQRIINDRISMMKGEMPMDWGFAENLAYASLLGQGWDVRLVGQDSGRGTFFHRHAVLHNQEDGSSYIPLRSMKTSRGRFRVIDSLLSEEAVLAYEYGFATAEPKSLVIWEAQFGDFANGAQVVIDQFISSGEAKWGRSCGLVMFLPHGYEGQGPEHSSARLERYMQLCANYNIQVCMPTTPAQMFHMLRRQMLRSFRKPLIVMTPKSLLRHKSSVSTIEDISNGGFQLVIADKQVDAGKIERLILCSGKVYFDLEEELKQRELDNVSIVRVEQLYPFPRDELFEAIKPYTNLKELVWCQEEPRNQGAWYQIKHHLNNISKKHTLALWYAGRRRSPSPAVGQIKVHLEQQKTLVNDALTMGTGTFKES